MNSTPNIALARSSDLEEIWHIERLTFPGPDQFSRRQLRSLLRSPNTSIFLCWIDKICAGYGIALLARLRNGKKKGRIYSIAVLCEQRRKGAGSALLTTMERHLKQVGAEYITLETRIGKKGAEGFFRKKGYTRTATLPEYYSSGSAARMRKDLRTTEMMQMPYERLGSRRR